MAVIVEPSNSEVPAASTIAVTPPDTDPKTAISVRNLRKSYRTGFWLNKIVTPLKNCTLTIQEGETYGLLGPNGAGKTTTIKCLLGIIKASAGDGTILGHPLGDDSIKHRLGYLPENPYLYDYLTGWEFLTFSGRLFQLSKAQLNERIPQLLEEVGLPIDTARKKQLRKYSKGMLQRVAMAQTLINDPDVVFLDEPMSGLDPIGRAQFRDIILELKKQGKTIFFNSHILSDVEVICDRVALLVKGEIIAQGSLKELLQSDSGYRIQGIGGNLEQLAVGLTNWQRLSATDTPEKDVFWQADWYGEPEACTVLLERCKASLLDMKRHQQTLEEYFLAKADTESAIS